MSAVVLTLECALRHHHHHHNNTGSRPDLQDSHQVHVGGEGHSIRAVGSPLPQLHGSRSPFRVHRGWHVRREAKEKGLSNYHHHHHRLLFLLLLNLELTLWRTFSPARGLPQTVTEKDFLDSINKVIKGYAKFSATPKYMVYN